MVPDRPDDSEVSSLRQALGQPRPLAGRNGIGGKDDVRDGRIAQAGQPCVAPAHDLVERPVEQVGLVAQDDGLRRPVARVEERPRRRRQQIDPPACLQP